MIANLTKTAFWDVNFDAIDFDKHSVYVVEKVFNYGLLADQKAIIKYYGRERIKEDILKVPYFDKMVLNFLCVVFELKKEQFECYQRAKFYMNQWSI